MSFVSSLSAAWASANAESAFAMLSASEYLNVLNSPSSLTRSSFNSSIFFSFSLFKNETSYVYIHLEQYVRHCTLLFFLIKENIIKAAIIWY